MTTEKGDDKMSLSLKEINNVVTLLKRMDSHQKKLTINYLQEMNVEEKK